METHESVTIGVGTTPRVLFKIFEVVAVVVSLREFLLEFNLQKTYLLFSPPSINDLDLTLLHLKYVSNFLTFLL